MPKPEKVVEYENDALYAMAAVWASIDGKLKEFGAGRHAKTAEEAYETFGGYYEGYMEDAQEFLIRLWKRGFKITKI